MNRKQRRAARAGRKVAAHSSAGTPPDSGTTVSPGRTDIVDRPDEADTFETAKHQSASLFRAGRLDEAEANCLKLLDSRPDNADVLHLLGAIALKRGDNKLALQHLKRAVALKPDDAEIHYRLGTALAGLGLLGEAINALRRSIELDPRGMPARRQLGHQLLVNKKVEEAAEVLERSIQIRNDDAASHYILGNVYRAQNRTRDSIASYRRAVSLDPEMAVARLGACVVQLPMIYDSEEEIAERRAAYERSLHELCDYYEGKPAEVLARAASSVGALQPYYLAYQGQNDRDLQALYGGLMCRLMAAGHPQWSEPLPMPAPEPDGRIRVGILSGFFRGHSNWKIPIKGWAEQLDRRKVRLFGYHTQKKRDILTESAAETCDRFVTDCNSLQQWVETILGDDLHVLIIPEVGMDPVTAQLAALRLAPIQCGSWGHPETSGYPTMDYFLSSDLMEPENGQENYTETLVRLPNLSVHYSLPKLEPVEVTRAELGLRPDSVAYWCCQALFKYLPRHDELFPRIAAEVGNCQFIFIRHHSELTTRRFQARLTRAFSRFGLSAEEHCVFVDRLPGTRFSAAMKSADLFLDSLGWSGCNTTMEAIGVGLPVITCPGEHMRGRHSAAILRMLDLDQAIAETPDAYIDLAVALGHDAERRAELRRLTVERHGRAYGDLACIRGLEDFLCGLVGSA